MTDDIYLYVDGESHYIRSEAACKEVFGRERTLADIIVDQRYTDRVNIPMGTITCEPKLRFFWDNQSVHRATGRTGHPQFPYVDRKTYFTSLVGTDPELFEANKFVRAQGFEPCIVKEKKSLQAQREQGLERTQVIEKAKGVDIALATRMIADAFNDLYAECYLFTSDIDYLPVIEEVRRMGKKVTVVGSLEGLGDQSKFLYVPDQFIDIGKDMMARSYRVMETPANT